MFLCFLVIYHRSYQLGSAITTYPAGSIVCPKERTSLCFADTEFSSEAFGRQLVIYKFLPYLGIAQELVQRITIHPAI